MAGKTRQQGHGVAGHIAATVKKQKEMLFSWFPPFYTVQDPCPGNSPAHSQEGCSLVNEYSQDNPPQVCSEAHLHVVLGSLELAELTIDTSHYRWQMRYKKEFARRSLRRRKMGLAFSSVRRYYTFVSWSCIHCTV